MNKAEEIIKEFESKPDPTIKDLGMLFRAFSCFKQPSHAIDSPTSCETQGSECASSYSAHQEESTTYVAEEVEAAGLSQQPPDDAQATKEAMPPNPGKYATHRAALPSKSTYEKYSHRMLLRLKHKNPSITTTIHQRVPTKNKKKKTTDKMFCRLYGKKMKNTANDFVRLMERLKWNDHQKLITHTAVPIIDQIMKKS